MLFVGLYLFLVVNSLLVVLAASHSILCLCLLYYQLQLTYSCLEVGKVAL